MASEGRLEKAEATSKELVAKLGHKPVEAALPAVLLEAAANPSPEECRREFPMSEGVRSAMEEKKEDVEGSEERERRSEKEGT